MLLTYLLCVPSWQPVMPSHVGVHLPEWRGDGRPVLLLVPGGALIAAIVVVPSLLTSIWLWLYLTVRGKNFVPQNSGCFSPWLGRCRVCNILRVGESACFYLRSSLLSPLAKPQAELQRIWWEALGTLNMTSDHFYVSENIVLKSSYFWSFQGWTGMLRPFRELLVLSQQCQSNAIRTNITFFCVEEWSVLQD